MRTVPDERVSVTVDVTPWLDRKIAAVLAHRTEVARGAAPGLIAALSAPERERLLGTEWYICHDLTPAAPPWPGRS
jgi:N-acetyl-1-D-myo-inositol-2-amino-2-deoxy-alpha-D-glucopyranoside deacetylase